MALFGRTKLRKVPCLGFQHVLFLLVMLAGSEGLASPVDHIGPDPVRSENCVLVTPHRSFNCRGRYVPPSDLGSYPAITVNCGPGIHIILTHEPVERSFTARDVTLITDMDEMQAEWLEISDRQSMLLLFDEPAHADEYAWSLNFLGRMITRGLSRFGYALVPGEGASGVFDLDHSDRELVHSIVSECR